MAAGRGPQACTPARPGQGSAGRDRVHGSWTALPCQETGSSGQTDHRPPQRATDEDAR